MSDKFIVEVAEGSNILAGQHEAEEAAFLEYEKKRAPKLKAAKAYKVMLQSFRNKNGEHLYPDNFAGARIEGNILHVALTSLDNDTVAKYKEIFGDLSDSVVFEAVTYSLNDLDSLKEGMVDTLSMEFPVVAWFNDVRTNRIVMECLMSEFTDVKRSLEFITKSRSFVSNYAVGKAFNSNLFSLQQGEVTTPCANVYGGMKMAKGSAFGGSRSIGVCGTIHSTNGNDYRGCVTAGHNLETTGTNATQYVNDKLFGPVRLLMWKNNGLGDWAAISQASSNNDTLTNKIYGKDTGFTRTIADYDYDIVSGDSYMRFGMTTGYHTGEVITNDVTTMVADYTVRGLTRVTIGDGHVDDGDSGGPFYVSAGNSTQSFCGVTTSKAASSICFTPYGRFDSYFTPFTS